MVLKTIRSKRPRRFESSLFCPMCLDKDTKEYCGECGVAFEQIAPYTWKPKCEHFPEDVLLAHL